jgi:hypothetical protein
MFVRLHDLIPVLQVAIGPVILISGVGLLLLTMTNRFGRTIDRSRVLADKLRNGASDDRPRIGAQVAILNRRVVLIRRAIILASVSVLCAAILIILLFVMVLMQLEFGLLVIVTFTFCLLSLIGSMIAFIQDIDQSLGALRLELSDLP